MSEVKLLKKAGKIFNHSPLVIENPKAHSHIHSYGGLSPFYEGLAEGKLMGTRCTSSDCEESRIWLPPRVDCPDCFQCMEWVEAPLEGKIYTHSTVLYPGAGFKLSNPCPLISIELEGVCTKLMSYLKEGDPKIGMSIKAVFNTDEPTYTILDLAWIPA